MALEPSAFVKVQRSVLCLALVVGTLLAPRVASALDTIPGEIKEVMQLACVPTCLLCHTDEDGGRNDLNSFGARMGAEGITNQVVGVEGVFGEAGKIVVENIDVDGDGVNDREEILANQSPNTKEAVGICSDAIYGCGAAQMAPGGTPRTSVWGLVAALGVAALLLRQLRRA